MSLPRGSLYAITPPIPPHQSHDNILLTMCQQALAGGVAVIQYRDKTSPMVVKKRRAIMLAELCHRQNAIFLINDSPELAQQCAADGVHLGQDDGSVQAAKTSMGGGIVGVSCQNSIAHAVQAVSDGADYLALGAVFPTTSKPNVTHCSLLTIAQIKAQCNIPIVAIGGITLHNIAAVKKADADVAAICKGLFDAPDITDTASKLCKLMQQ